MNPIRHFRLTLALCLALGLWLLIQDMTARAEIVPANAPPITNTLDAAASLSNYEAACTNGIGDVADLISDINTANTNPGPDTISLGDGCTYTFTLANNYWYGPNALPAIASEITIEGNSARLVNTNATRLRFFYVGADPLSARTPGYHTPGAGVLTLHNLTLAGGIARGGTGSGGGAGMGGAIFNQGTLLLERVTLSDNTAIGGNAGVYYGGGGGLGEDGNGAGGGGFGGAVTPAGSSGAGNSGGGGGFRPTDNATGVAGGGVPDGLGGRSASRNISGNGSGGGDGTTGTSTGGNFGFGGNGASSNTGSGGGVGGGGEKSSTGGGGGGFGGGGGGGFGGFGGGGGENLVYVAGGLSGFGGGPTLGGTGHGGGGAGMGGAIFNHGGSLTLTNSTLTANTARGGGSLQGDAMSLGGAIFNLNGSVTLLNSTLAENTVVVGAPGSLGTGGVAAGGALYNLRYTLDATIPDAVVVLQNSILANSNSGSDLVNYRPTNLVAASGGGANTGAASVTFATLSLVESRANNGGIFADTVTPLVGIDPQLGPLSDYGGGTQTMALSLNSPAIDRGIPANCAATDQRGFPRNDLRCDIGAFEMQYADSDTVIRPVAANTLTTFGPALAGVQRDETLSDPGIITVTKKIGWATQGPESIGAWWEITPTVTEEFSLTLQLCYTAVELGVLNENDLRFWRLHEGGWEQIGGAPTLTTVNGHRCVTMSGVDRLSVWTLATAEPTAVTLSTFSVASPVGWVGWLIGLLGMGGMGTAVLRRRKR